MSILRRRRPRGPARASDLEATAPRRRRLRARQTVYEETIPPPPIWPWFLLLLLLAVAIGLGVLYVLTRSDDDGSTQPTTTSAPVVAKVDVPQVVGEPADEAAAMLVDAGLKPRFERQVSKKASGIVLEQDPAAATPVERGTTVVLTISRGRDTVAVPAVTGLSLAQALKTVQSVKLKATVKRVASDKPEGQVVAQTPGGGRELKPGATVELTVSRGKPKVTVPDVVGQDQAAATATLERAGLQAAAREVPNRGPKGTVVAQSPEGGETTRKGSTVQINISKGPQTTTSTTTTAPSTPVTVPDVVGLTETAAKERLRNAGFKIDARTVPSTEPQGTVVAQFPAAGDTAKRGGTILINVSRGGNRTP
jgi:serine/threonine-protein kinase